MSYFLPDQWFEFLAGKSILLVFGTLAVSFAALFKGSDWFVDGAAGIAKKLGIPVVIIGVTIVSLGTTSPEATVSIMAAFSGKSGFALGNAIGSIISNTALVFGLCCALSKIPVDKFVIKRQGVVKFSLCIGFVAFCYVLSLFKQNNIARPFGFTLLGFLIWYIYKSVKWSNEHHENGITDPLDVNAKKSHFLLTLIFISGLIVVVIASRILIASATQIALRFGVPEEVIAATIVAFGTSVPELATGIASVIKGHKGLLLGNIIGANILNILIVIGGVISVTGLKITPIFYKMHFPFFAIVIILFTFFSLFYKKFYNRMAGVILVSIYFTYVVVQYVCK
ncbi:MAG: Inner membrane protein YrbG [Planctomycetes bacterium ADurb.Bin401]|nr:MAG: Inner membrane protein YrbG [Planctomycetes bacterium ADurb.Bin401]